MATVPENPWWRTGLSLAYRRHCPSELKPFGKAIECSAESSSSHYGRLLVFVAHFVGALCRAVLRQVGLFDKVADKVCRQSFQTSP
jgi:hypothetical protein